MPVKERRRQSRREGGRESRREVRGGAAMWPREQGMVCRATWRGEQGTSIAAVASRTTPKLTGTSGTKFSFLLRISAKPLEGTTLSARKTFGSCSGRER